MDTIAFRKLHALAISSVPMTTRVSARLAELQHVVAVFAETGRNRFKTTDEWEEFRRMTHLGFRIAHHFKREDSKLYFGTLFDTATTHLRQTPGTRLHKESHA